MAKKEKIFMRKIPEGLKPADNYAYSLFDKLKICNGDIVGVYITKLRKQGSNKNAHKIGGLCREHIEAFSHYDDSHKVLKRLQIESGAACEEIGVMMGDMMHMVRIPLSLSFDSLGEDEFIAAVKTICRHISEKYWKGVDPEKIELMSERFVNE